MDLQEVGCGGRGLHLSDSGQGQVAATRKRQILYEDKS